MNNAVFYRGMWLVRNSRAYELYHDKDDKGHKILDKHLKQLAAAHKELLERYG